MAFTRATGKHRRPSRTARASGRLAGVAGLATAGAVGSLAAPAVAAPAGPSVERTGLTQAVVLSETLAESVGEQADRQQRAAAEAEAKKRAAEAARKKAAEAAERAAAKRAAEARAEKKRAARAAAAKRAALNGYVAPIAGSYVSTAYGAGGAMWSSGSHSGADFHAASGTSVRSVAAGEVVEAGWGGAYGNNVVIRHNDGRYTQYGHLSSVTVAVGRSVGKGAQIGLSGSTGNSSGPHLHFEVRTGPDYGSDVDPVAYLRQHGVNV